MTIAIGSLFGDDEVGTSTKVSSVYRAFNIDEQTASSKPEVIALSDTSIKKIVFSGSGARGMGVAWEVEVDVIAVGSE